MCAVLVVGGKGHVFAGLALAHLRRDGLESGQPIRNIIRKARLRLLAVADDVDAERKLLVDNLADSLARFPGQGGLIDALLVDARQHEIRKRRPAWEAAHVGRDNAAPTLIDET